MRSMNAVFHTAPPLDLCKRSLAWSSFPEVRVRVTSPTRFFSVRVMTVTLHRSFHTRQHALPGPAVSSIFSRNARFMLVGDTAHPSVATRTARRVCAHARTWISTQFAT